MRHAVRVWPEHAGLRFLGQFQARPGQVGIGLVEHGEVGRVVRRAAMKSTS
jgi:hypothetical protein